MCGIIGSIGKSFSLSSESMNVISHRGPDDRGTFQDEYVSFGHFRLSILDLTKNGHQPMKSVCGGYVIIFNGEIYNHNEIRKTLEPEYQFNSTSDTETILYGFIKYGTSIFEKLNGIFAIVIYDLIKKEVIIARDQFGQKPLYYSCLNNTLVFSSELKGLLQVNGLNKTINTKAISNYLRFLWCPGTDTPFLGTHKLDAGYFMRVPIEHPEQKTLVRYYDIPFSGSYSIKSEEELINELDELLLKAVKRQLQSDVPVGFFLSGGLDSSAIVALAKKLNPGKRLQCYTIDANSIDQKKEGFSDDLFYAKKVAEYLDVDLEIVKVENNIVEEFDKMIWHLDEPQADAAPLNVLKICEKAKSDGIKVLLGGTAGDDLFSGYRRHQALNFEKYFTYLNGSRGRVIKKIILSIPFYNPGIRRLKKLALNINLPKLERMYRYFEWLPLNRVNDLFTFKLKHQLKEYKPEQYFFNLLKNIPNEKNSLNQMLYWEMKTFLPAHNLNYTDKMSMAIGVEVRVPFLDTELVEFSTKIPPSLKMKGNETKYLLKKVMERYLPKDVIYRPKAGFGAPVRKWITQDLEPMINEYLSEATINKREIFNYAKVKELISDNKKDKIDASYSIWCLLAIESWMRQFLDPIKN